MNEEKILQTLAARSQPEAPPTVDVVKDVLARLQFQRPARRGSVLLWVYAGVTAAAATFIGAWALQAMIERHNAVLDIVVPVMGAMP